jgi:hypothetical protein
MTDMTNRIKPASDTTGILDKMAAAAAAASSSSSSSSSSKQQQQQKQCLVECPDLGVPNTGVVANVNCISVLMFLLMALLMARGAAAAQLMRD